MKSFLHKVSVIILAGTLTLGTAFCSVSALDTSGAYTYEVLYDGTVAITNVTSASGTVSVPSAINGRTVSEISAFSFSGNTGITSITIPDTVSYIGSYAFADCTNLSGITLSKNLKDTGDGVFLNTKWLNAQKDSAIYIGSCLYSVTGSPTSLSIKDGTTLVMGGAVADIASIKSVTIPSSVKYIGASAFAYCSSLTELTVPNSVKYIGDSAFLNCTSLSKVSATQSLEYVGNNAFESTPWLKANLSQHSDEVIYIGSCAYTYSGTITSPNLEIKSGTTGITSSAFYEQGLLESVTLPESIKAIGEKAFFGCDKLKSITLSGEIQYIGSSAFGVYFDFPTMTIKPIDSFTVYGKANTVAKLYASGNNLKFVDTSSKATGDLNGDGKADINDVTLMQRYFVLLASLSDSQIKHIDVNGDGSNDIKDATYLQRIIVDI